jgi:2-keto-4-pentenoate hydratase
MTDIATQAAADLIWDCWTTHRRIAAIPSEIAPASRQDGYAIQQRLASRSTAPLFGWKIAATSKAGQAHINVDGPLAGRLLAERVIANGEDIPFTNNHMRVAEAEFAFRMGADLPPRGAPYSTQEALAAVASLHPAIEIPDSRFDDFTIVGAPQLIADNACADYFVLGAAAVADWRAIDLGAHHAIGSVSHARGGREQRQGVGANVLGDPRDALAWLVNELSSIGITLRAGEVVTTGTCVAPMPIDGGDTVEADFGVLGRATARIAYAM